MSQYDKVLDVISEVSGVERDRIEPRMDLVADLGIDSPKALQLLVKLEQALGIEISDEEAARMETVDDILQVTQGSVAV